jgi:hypothetical protein
MDGSQPHPSRGRWEDYLTTCELRGEADGTRWYGQVNCNYLVFPNGVIVQNYGYHGRVLLDLVRREGSSKVYADLLRDRRKVQRLLVRIGAAQRSR